jgi:DNA polymerase III subunit beta
MKFKTKKENLIWAVSKAEKIADKNISLPVLANIVIKSEKNKIKTISNNLDIGVELEYENSVEGEGVVALSGQVLISFLNSLSKNENEIEIEAQDNVLKITGKKSKSKIVTHSVEDFPDLPEINTKNSFKIKSEIFVDGLKSVWYAASLSNIKPELSSVYIYIENEDLVFVATDSFRLAEKRIKVKNLNQNINILIPFKNVIEIVRILEDVKEDVNIFVEENQIGIISNGIKIISRIIEGNFPDYKQIIPKNFETKVTVLKDDFLRVFKAVNVFSDKFNQASISIDTKTNELKVLINNQEKGVLDNVVDIKSEGGDIEVNFNYKYILDSVNSFDSESLILEFNGKLKPLVIRGLRDSSFTYLVMPMNK